MPTLDGRTIAITEARRATELATLITKLGGRPYSAPAVREVPRADLGPALAVLERICEGDVSLIIFLTGVGARAFLGLAARAGRLPALLTALAAMRVVARGPKPLAVLRAAGVLVHVIPSEPTSEGVLAALQPYPLEGHLVAVQLYGDDNPVLVQGLSARGASVLEIALYEWAPPENDEPLVRLVQDLIGGGIDVLAFTSSPQVTNVFAVAERLGLAPELRSALDGTVAVAAIGPVCEAALREQGVIPRIRAAKGTMGALIHAVAEHFTPGEGPPARP